MSSSCIMLHEEVQRYTGSLLARLHTLMVSGVCRLSSSSVVVCYTCICNVSHQGAARDGGPVVLRPVMATTYYIRLIFFVITRRVPYCACTCSN